MPEVYLISTTGLPLLRAVHKAAAFLRRCSYETWDLIGSLGQQLFSSLGAPGAGRPSPGGPSPATRPCVAIVPMRSRPASGRLVVIVLRLN